MEDYIAMYSTKEKVVDAVTTLHVTILKAIEDVIGYYTRHISGYQFYPPVLEY